jgi:hypothetical protein
VILGVQKERFTTRPVFISSVASESDRSFPERSTEHDMDEPFGALDFLTRLKMRADLVRIRQKRKENNSFRHPRHRRSDPTCREKRRRLVFLRARPC